MAKTTRRSTSTPPTSNVPEDHSTTGTVVTAVTPSATSTTPATYPRGKHPLLRFGVPRKPQSSAAMLPLLRPPDDASPEEWQAYRDERRRRRVIKAERRGRIGRREQPHDPTTCEQCMAVRDVADRLLAGDIDVPEVARRALVSKHHVYRVLSPNVSKRRGLRTLTTMRRIAHDGLGISLDALALILELK